jgi:SAM-dependent methyltransferase/predicted enzyme related to lactoylglutathione lyase
VADSYGTLAEVYEWLVPDPLLTPRGSVEAFATVVDRLPVGSRVLDCAAGIGQLAVGLALRGFEVVAADASRAMVERIRVLALQSGVDLPVVACEWEGLRDQGWQDSFDAVFCVGNSLTHAAGTGRRQAALAAMAAVLRPGGLLVLTSRNWERVRAERPGLQVADQLVQRGGQQALVVHAWTIPDRWEDQHSLDVAVAVIDDAGGVTTRSERLSFWPFTHQQLGDDLRAAGLLPESSTYGSEVERYLVTARRDRDCTPWPGLRNSAQQRGTGEHPETGQEDATAGDEVPEPAGEQQQPAEGDQNALVHQSSGSSSEIAGTDRTRRETHRSSDEFSSSGWSVQVTAPQEIPEGAYEEENMASPTLGSILLASTNPDRLRAWYAAALAPEKDTVENGYGVLKFGGFHVLIDSRTDIGEANPEPGRLILNFDVDDARATAARLDDIGAKWLAELEDRDGSLFGTVIDPDGNYVQIIQLSEEHRAAMGNA